VFQKRCKIGILLIWKANRKSRFIDWCCLQRSLKSHDHSIAPVRWSVTSPTSKSLPFYTLCIAFRIFVTVTDAGRNFDSSTRCRMSINQSINQSSFISGMTERRPRIHNKHNIHSNSSRVTCLIFVFIEHSCNEVRV